MSLYDSFIKSVKDEEKRSQAYPIIWKKTKSLEGECAGNQKFHRWSVPLGSGMGLMTECYDCHKARIVQIDSHPDVWVNHNTGNEWAAVRLKELHSQ
jgi:hypothetical protein